MAAFVAGNLVAISTGPGLTAGKMQSKVFMYQTVDTFAETYASGYFNNVTGLLSKGDLILVSAVNGGTPTCGMLVVTSVTGAATVTTAASLATAIT